MGVERTETNKIPTTPHKGQVFTDASREKEWKSSLEKKIEKSASLYAQRSAEGTVSENIERAKHLYKREPVPPGVIKEPQDPGVEEVKRKLAQADEKVEQVRGAMKFRTDSSSQ